MLNKALSREARAIGLDKQDDFKLEMQNQAEKSLARRRREHIMASLPTADLTAVARESYLINGARYAVPAVYETWHVLINTKKRSKQDAQKLAEELRTKLVAGANTARLYAPG